MPRKKVTLPKQIQFEWDKGNLNKNKLKHNVDWTECEEVFFNKPLIVGQDPSHSTESENRYQALGKTNNQRLLFIAFTIRNEKIRVISARNQDKKERTIYGGGEKK
ncbi:MAG: BrnT family toxin [Patescibacteria group bacterium]